MKFGLLGKSLTHSFSKKYFDSKFEKENLEHSYTNIELEDISLIKEYILENKYDGINVTIPYKEQIIPYLDNIDTVASKIQAVNCIQIKNNILIGYNTDVIGFMQTIIPYLKNTTNNSALLFGNGGASKAVKYVLELLQIPYTIVSRKNSPLLYTTLTAEEIEKNNLLIHTTPLGTSPTIDDCIPIAYEAVGNQHICIDLIYNPSKTKFLNLCEQQGASICNGYTMLTEQAEESYTFWTS